MQQTLNDQGAVRTNFREQYNPVLTAEINNGSFSDMQFPGAYQVNPATAAAAGGLGTGVYQHYPNQNQQHLQHIQVTANSLAHMSQGQQFQRLKVEDALSYLDQVKLQFGNQPQVYNDFLDIMKEFKSQTIDTPGVIKRVSSLFQGHPDLVVGFNTFLPPGYKIEVQANDTISFHQPGQPAVALQPVNIPSRHLPTLPQQNTALPSAVSASNAANAHHSYHQPARLPPEQSLPSHAHVHNSGPPPPNQPVEFNHAINYVNKIKNRFQGQPEIYKAFLEILHTYQKEQKNLKEGLLPAGHKPLTEAQVYDQVAKLFQNQEDLLSEFGQFLPDANSSSNYPMMGGISAETMLGGVRNDHSSTVKKPMAFSSNKMSATVNSNKPGHLRRQPGPVATTQPPAKKLKPSALKDVSVSEAGKYGTLNEFAFFDKVRKVLKSQESYEDFLRCLSLFNQEIVGRTELVQMVQPFLSKYADLYKSFKEIVGHKEMPPISENGSLPVVNKERISSDLAMQIDFSSCKRYGASYRGLPKSFPLPKCSGRTPLCKEVLNDTLVSIPSWSEDSNFVTAKKTHYEELIYRCEDERYQLDIIIENNADTIRVLESVQRKLVRMTAEEATKYHLDDSLGGTSEVLHRKAIQRIYGDKAADIIDGLKKSPAVAVPLVLRRLKAKDEEWREAQSGFNRVWRDQNEKFYLKSLDHQGINFKQTDAKLIRSKALLNEIETIFEEHQEQENGAEQGKPHLTYTYADKALFADCWSLILHHMRRQSGIAKADKFKMKQLLLQLIPAFFFQPVADISDEEPDNEEDDIESEGEGDIKKEKPKRETDSDSVVPQSERKKESLINGFQMDSVTSSEDSELADGDDVYRLFFANNHWYLLFRLHDILYERLYKISQQARRLVEEEIACRKERKESTAIALRLKLPNPVEPEGYYNCFVEMAKNVLDGNLESYMYEDSLREMFGIHAYIAFTIDKIVQNIVRQLQHVASDEASVNLTAVLLQEWKNGGAGGKVSSTNQRQAVEAIYQKKAEQMLSDENCFRLTFHKNSGRLAIELLNTESNKSEDAFDGEAWSESRDKFDKDESADKEHLPLRPVFLARNIRNRRKQQQQQHNKQSKDGDENEKKEEKCGENFECRFDVNSYKMVYVVNNENYLYKRNALARAHRSFMRVSCGKHAKFMKIVDKWCDKNVSEQLELDCSDWLMGHKVDMLLPCVTILNRITDISVPPHYVYNRYRVDFTQTESMEVAEQEETAENSDTSAEKLTEEMEQQ